MVEFVLHKTPYKRIADESEATFSRARASNRESIKSKSKTLPSPRFAFALADERSD
ncbi:MAG: hypothetical protein HZA08_12060 [Nitrospirae bacterium]|nr:hypothetical protein [Nitrospirota bacterium]